MADDPELEYRVILSLIKTINDGTSIPVQYRGVRFQNNMGNAASEEWIAIDLLSTDPIPSRKEKYRGNFLFQVTCFSKFAALRTIKKVHRPWQMAGEIRVLLDQKAISIRDLDQPAPAEFACMEVTRQGAIYLPETAPGLSSVNPPEGDTTTGTHAVAMTFNGVLNTA